MPFTKKGIPGEESDWVSGELQTRVQFRTCSEIEMLVIHDVFRREVG